MSNLPTLTIIVFYLLAIVVSNIVVAMWGQAALIFTSLILIPFDFVARDILHERWQGKSLLKNIVLLGLAGSLITIILNTDAVWIALASVTAMCMALTVNTILYKLLYKVPRFKRMAVSNTITACVDSVVFPLIAFGGLSITLSIIQIISKSLGSLAWARVFICSKK